MARKQNNRRSRSNNNNPEGRNQYTSGWMGMARERTATAAAVAAGTVAAGVFLWSKRAQIGEQLNQLSDQIGEWTENLNSSGERELETVAGGSEFGGTSPARRTGASTAGSARRSNSNRSGSIPASTGEGGPAPA